jgi:hypothetical protein
MRVRFGCKPGSSQPRVDREKRIIYGASVIQAGEALGHDMLIDDRMLAQTAEAINATEPGIKSRFTHPGACSDSMGKMLGKVKNASVCGDKVTADLHLAQHASKSPEGDLAEYVMSMAEESPADFGMSIAFDGSAVFKRADGAEVPVSQPRPADATTAKPFARLGKLRAVDVVDEPAANRDGLFSAFAGTTNLDAAEMFAAIDQARDAMGWSDATATEFLGRYIAARKPKEKRMDPIKFAALLDAEPAHAAALGKLFAAGKTEAEITAALSDLKRDAETAALKADLAAAKANVDKLTAELAAANDAKAKAEAKHAALAKMADAPADPGATPTGGTAAKTEDQIKAAWSALPDSERAAFLGDFGAYRFHVLNDKPAAKSGDKE